MVDAVIDIRPVPRQRASLKRTAMRLRSLARVTTAVPEEIRQHDPLVRDKVLPTRLAGWALFGLIAAAGAHVCVLGLFFLANAAWGNAKGMIPNDPRIEVAIVQPPPPEEPVVAEPEAKKPKTKKPKTKKVPPPPDPIDLDQPKEKPKTSPRRIIGLNMASTVEGGGGPAFAVGNTRMGKTNKVAEKPEVTQEPLPKEPPKQRNRANRVATRIPTSGPKVVMPRRKQTLKPDYPELYKTQGIESAVTVRVNITTGGRVSQVDIVAPSRYAEFNEAATKAAFKEEFVPAMRGGKPIAFTISFTYWFTLNS